MVSTLVKDINLYAWVQQAWTTQVQTDTLHSNGKLNFHDVEMIDFIE